MLTILIADDEPHVAELVRLTLEDERIHVVVALDGQTALAQAADVARGLTAGANHYMTKPFSPVRLLSLVESVVPQAIVWPRA